ncbi:hypothetical protein Y032_0078g1206 [Ancylostoma ceylanicum]|uniref:Uncharacterized protein n=1 Tax=Ancylostoma ceylanicum TaxID=53326 RepID=A0A016TSZ4_9BILA|nr:hypothetical protein Y032_0078g1206 [Ancylostoma ceylanicum]
MLPQLLRESLPIAHEPDWTRSKPNDKDKAEEEEAPLGHARMARSRSRSTSHSSRSSRRSYSSGSSSTRSRETSPEDAVESRPMPGVDYQSPLATLRIPHKVDFATAQKVVPTPPPLPQRALRVRVALSDECRAHFDSFASGTLLSHSDR